MSLPNAYLPERAGLRLVPPARRSSGEDAGVLPHEAGFFALYALVIARLLFSPLGVAWTEVGIWASFAATSAVLVALTRDHGAIWAWRVRLGGYVVLMNAAYFRMGAVFAATDGVRRDAALQHVDMLLFGKPLPLYFDAASHVVASELLSFCYFLLFPYILVSCGRHLVRLKRAPAEARAFYSGLFLVYAIGFAGYLLVPAQGAWLDMAHAFRHDIAGGWMTALNRAVVERGSNRVDVFPSLHVAASAFMLFFDRRFARWRYQLYLPAAVGLWISTVYLRFHYGIDVIAGALLAGLALRVAFAIVQPPRASIEVTLS
jgi:membrane-associated phospholipid phosphatase